jgi:hypothetical protein
METVVHLQSFTEISVMMSAVPWVILLFSQVFWTISRMLLFANSVKPLMVKTKLGHGRFRGVTLKVMAIKDHTLQAYRKS